MTLRAARPEDLDALRTCFEAAFAPWVARLPDLPDITADLPDQLDQGLVYVLSDDARLLAALVMRIAHGRVHLINLAVHPDAAGQGLGRRLIQHAEQAGRAAKAQDMTLATHAGMDSTIAFYKRLGFVEVARHAHRLRLEKPL